jgi:hypothetical protein
MNKLSTGEAKEEIERLTRGMPTVAKGLYVWPNRQTESAVEAFQERISGKKFGFLPVRGSVGAGKTRLLNEIKETLRTSKMAISNVYLKDADEIRQMGISTFMPWVLIQNFGLMEEGHEEKLLSKMEDENFRKKVRRILEDEQKYNRLFYHGSRHLAVVFDALTSEEPALRRAARKWLEGYEPGSDDDRGKEELKRMRELGLETSAKSVRILSTDKTLFFLRDLADELGYSPYLVIVDEIEKAGELPPKAGKSFLSGIRDLINLLYATQHDLPEQDGLFVILSISNQYLDYAGIGGAVEEGEQATGREKFSRPKTDLRDVPRLHSVLSSIQAWADVTVEDRAVMVKIGEIIRDLYKVAHPGAKIDSVDIKSIVDGLYKATNELLPRQYVPRFVDACQKAAEAAS